MVTKRSIDTILGHSAHIAMTTYERNRLEHKNEEKSIDMGEQDVFDTGWHPRIIEIAKELDRLRAESDHLLMAVKDTWTPLGRRAPFLREAFKGVTLPIGSREGLLEALGGSDRVIVAPGLDGHLIAVSASDMIESLGRFLDDVLPVKDWNTLVKEIIRREARARQGKEGGMRLLRNIQHENLKAILNDPKRIHRAFPDQSQRVYSQQFERKRPAYEVLARRPRGGSVRSIIEEARAYEEYTPWILHFELLQQLLDLIGSLANGQRGDTYANTVQAKTSSANTHLNNAEQRLSRVDSALNRVLNATRLTSSVESNNRQAENELDSAAQLIAQAIADLAAAEAALQQIPNNPEAQNAVAEAQDRLEQVQNEYSRMLDKMAEAEAHKDILRIPEICITVRCIEDDPCCDDDWNGVTVCIRNTSNPDVPEKCGTTSGNGSVTICGRFGNSNLVITTVGPKNWNYTRNLSTGTTSTSTTIKKDLPGIE